MEGLQRDLHALRICFSKRRSQSVLDAIEGITATHDDTIQALDSLAEHLAKNEDFLEMMSAWRHSGADRTEQIQRITMLLTDVASVPRNTACAV